MKGIRRIISPEFIVKQIYCTSKAYTQWILSITDVDATGSINKINSCGIVVKLDSHTNLKQLGILILPILLGFYCVWIRLLAPTCGHGQGLACAGSACAERRRHVDVT